MEITDGLAFAIAFHCICLFGISCDISRLSKNIEKLVDSVKEKSE